MKTSRAALLSLLCASVAGAAAAADYHVGASIGRSDYRIDTAGATSADTRDTAGKIFFGTHLTPHLGLEAAVFGLGSTRGTVAVPGVGDVSLSASVRGLAAYGVLSAPLGPVSVFAKAGLAHVRARLNSGAATGLPDSESSWQPAAGFGVSYAVAPQFAVRGEWERVRTRFPGGEKDNVDLLSLGLSYHF